MLMMMLVVVMIYGEAQEDTTELSSNYSINFPFVEMVMMMLIMLMIIMVVMMMNI